MIMMWKKSINFILNGGKAPEEEDGNTSWIKKYEEKLKSIIIIEMMIPKTESKVKTITIKTGYGTPYAPIKIPEKYTSGFYLEWLIDEDQKSRLTQVIDLMKVIQRSLWPKKVVAEDDLVFELHGNSLWMGMFYNIDEDIVSRMSVGKKKEGRCD